MHQLTRRPLRLAAAAAALALAVAAALAALPRDQAAATPSSGVTAELLARGTIGHAGHLRAAGVKLQTRGPVDVATVHVTIQPGGSTGWHYHDGRVFGVVREGTLTRTMADCTNIVSETGAAVIEESGSNHVHIGRNLGPVPVKLWVDYIEPAGAPLSVDVPDPGCGP
jgi:quercetin dioxygenase-like cupin family protein